METRKKCKFKQDIQIRKVYQRTGGESRGEGEGRGWGRKVGR